MININVDHHFQAPKIYANVDEVIKTMSSMTLEVQRFLSSRNTHLVLKIRSFEEHAKFYLEGIATLIDKTDLSLSGFKRIERCFNTFLTIGQQWGVGYEYVAKHENALLALKEKLPPEVEVVLPICKPPEIQVNAPPHSVQAYEEYNKKQPLHVLKTRIYQHMCNAKGALEILGKEISIEEQKQFVTAKKACLYSAIKNISVKLKGFWPDDELNELIYCLSKHYDRLTEFQMKLSSRFTNRSFCDVFPQLLPYIRAHEAKVASSTLSISPSFSLGEESITTLPLTIEEPTFREPEKEAPSHLMQTEPPVAISIEAVPTHSTQTHAPAEEAISSKPVESASSTEELHITESEMSESSHSIQEPMVKRTSARKRTLSSKLRDEGEIPEKKPTKSVKRQKIAKIALRMPFLKPDEYGETELLDEVVDSLKVEGQRTKKLYVSENIYHNFYEQFWGGQKGWSEYFKENNKLNSPQNSKLQAKYAAYKKQTLKEKSETFRIRQSKDHPVFGHMLFTTKKISKGDIIGEYMGHLVHKKTGETDENRYLFEFNSRDPKVDKYVIDGAGMCNEMAFVVHNDEARCNAEIRVFFDENGPHILLIAKKDIEAGSPPSINYGDGYWESIGFKPLCLDY